MQVRSKKDYRFVENTKDHGTVNTLEGLELHTPVLSRTEQLLMEEKITDWVHLGTQVGSVLAIGISPENLVARMESSHRLVRDPLPSGVNHGIA